MSMTGISVSVNALMNGKCDDDWDTATMVIVVAADRDRNCREGKREREL